MKNKICALYLAFCVLLSCVMIFPAKADNLSGFPDIQDTRTANAAESLRLMGALDGYAYMTALNGSTEQASYSGASSTSSADMWSSE